MFELKTSASFDSAHFLSGYQGKCSNLHGHRWKIEVTVGQETLQEEGNYRGMVIDFGDVKHAVKALADSYDHAMIYGGRHLAACHCGGTSGRGIPADRGAVSSHGGAVCQVLL